MGKKRNRAKLDEQKIEQSLLTRKIKLWLGSVAYQSVSLTLFYYIKNYIIDISELPDFYLYSWMFLFSARAAVTLILHFYMVSEKSYSLSAFNRIIRRKNILSVLLLAITIFPALYYSSFSLWLASFLQSVLDFSELIVGRIIQLIATTFAAISGYLGNILLGVIGNFIYDFLKKYYSQLKKRKKDYKKKQK